MTSIMLDVIYHVATDLLVAIRWNPTLTFVNKGLVFSKLFHLSFFRLLPEAITISLVNLNCLVMCTRYHDTKLPKWVTSV